MTEFKARIKKNKKGVPILEAPEGAEEAAKRQREAMEMAKKAQEEQINELMGVVKEKIFPELVRQDETIDDTKILVESLAVALNQGLYLLMKKTKVSEIGIKEQLSPDYPGREKWAAMLDLLADVSLGTAIESLQWMGAKADATIKAENKNRKFVDLNIDMEGVKK